MFDYRGFLMQGFRDAVGKMADYQVILKANVYFEKGVLLAENLLELQEMIDKKNAPQEEYEEIEEIENE